MVVSARFIVQQQAFALPCFPSRLPVLENCSDCPHQRPTATFLPSQIKHFPISLPGNSLRSCVWGASLRCSTALFGIGQRLAVSRAKGHVTLTVAMGKAEGLSEAQLNLYNENGYLVLDDFASPEECRALMARMEALVEGFDPATISVFSTKNQKKTTNEYFLNSGGNISFFFEEKAFAEDGTLSQPKELSINKVGHALHDLDPTFRAFSRSEKVAAVMASLGYRTPVPVQSMYIFKQPGIGGEVVPHQDSTFLFTDPPSCTGFWVALEDATEDNGCLWALPGSHRGGPARRFHLDDSGGVTFSGQAPEYDLSQFVAVPVRAGAAVLLHGALVHNSYENKSPKSRHAYSIHVIEQDGCQYLPDNWLQRKEGDPKFEPLYTSEGTALVGSSAA